MWYGFALISRIGHIGVLTISHCFSIGAGISVQAGIPDFRSPAGLFQTLKKDNPRELLASGKDLFDASVFNVSVYQYFNPKI